MKTLLLLVLTFFLFKDAYSQSKLNIVCRDFTFNQKKSNQGKNLKNIFEVMISKSSYPFKLLEIDKMDRIFETLQEEKNLVKDFTNEWKKKLQLANVDYLVVGDINENIAEDNFTLIIHLIKITGDNITEKLPMLITISGTQLTNNDELMIIFDKAIQSFIKTYILMANGENTLANVPEFYKELKKRDSIIQNHEISLTDKSSKIRVLDSTVTMLERDRNLKTEAINNLSKSVLNLQDENLNKDKELGNLKKSVAEVKDYTIMARLGLTGREFEVGTSLIAPETELSLLMKQVVTFDGSHGMSILLSDTALYYVEKVIQKFPKFPFGYYAKATILSRTKKVSEVSPIMLKALTIFEITTSIEGHNAQHDEALKKAREYMKRIGLSPSATITNN